MALIPSRHVYLDSLQSSLSKFHGTPLFFFRYTCSIPSKSQTLCSNSSSDKNPHRNSPHSSKSISLSTSSGWFHQWNRPSKQNRLKTPQIVFNYRNDGDSNYSGGGGGTTMEKIVEKLKRYGYMDGNEKREERGERVIEKGSVEDIFHVEEGMLPNSRGGFTKDEDLGVEDVFKSGGEVRFPWEKPKKKECEEGEEGKWTARTKSRTLLAEMTLPESELRRLRNLTFQIKTKVRIKGSGITQEVVDTIHEKWKTSEIVRIKVEGAPALNMKMMHEILERKTGGLVIWRSGTAVSLYRGVSYEVPSVHLNKRVYKRNKTPSNDLPATSINKMTRYSSKFGTTTNKMTRYSSNFSSTNESDVFQSNSEASIGTMVKREREMQPEVNYEDEVDKLLDGLGPRYTDWPGLDPLPVDADLLPGVVPGFQPPFRVLPYGVRSTLAQREATSLRRLARFLPPHFALGRSRQLQGLAAAMVKLWNKSKIAKIALKRGVQLTTSERMAEDLKRLTGGMLLSRNKDFLVFYRGKNFLSSEVAEALLERERLAKSLQEEEEQARLRASALVVPVIEKTEESGTAGTLEETLNADAKWGKKLDNRHKEKIMKEVEIARHNDLVRKLERKLAFAERKLQKAEYALSKVEAFLKPAERQADPHSITDEERFMFRKLGLRMKAFLLLGRRGVFDGTVENMHLHWKYRELVKILVKAKSIEQVKNIALALEAESGGVLVSVDRVSKGYAIIVYRGKNYSRPPTLRPRNLLTKRKALARSVEIQRREALLRHISSMETKVNKLRSEIEQMDTVKDHGDEELYDRLDSAYSTEEDDSESEEQGDEVYLETYNGEKNESDDNDDTNNSLHNVLETDFPYESENQEEDDGDETYTESYASESEDKDDEDYTERNSLITSI